MTAPHGIRRAKQRGAPRGTLGFVAITGTVAVLLALIRGVIGRD